MHLQSGACTFILIREKCCFMFKIIKFTVLLVFLFVSCTNSSKKETQKPDKKGKSGYKVKVTKNSKGQVKTSVSYKDGLKNGPAKTYYDNGKLKLQVNYCDNVLCDTSRKYYESGEIFKVTPHDSLGKIHGIVQLYRRKNGLLQAEIPYFHGQKQKGLKEYYVNGNPKTDYPSLKIKTGRNPNKSSEFFFEVYFSGKPSKCDYYLAPLTKDLTIPTNLQELDIASGVGLKTIQIPKGSELKQTIAVIGVLTTQQGNKYIMDKKQYVELIN